MPLTVQNVIRSPGKPLDPGIRASMESSFGHDFSRVRIHDDAPAADSAQAVHALAYTVGEDIVLGPGRFDSGSGRGRQLLAHELAHVAQQQNGAGLPAPAGPAAHSEHAADTAALAVASGQVASAVGATSVGLARQPQPSDSGLMTVSEATRVLVGMPAFQSGTDPSAGAMNVIAEVLQGPRTMENAVQRRRRLRAACSLLDPDSAAAVRATLTTPATANQRRLRDSFGMLHHAIRAELLEILSVRTAAREPGLPKLPGTASDLARVIRQLPASHSDQETASFVATALQQLPSDDPAVHALVLAALADTRPAVYRAIAAWLARRREASAAAAARQQAREQEQFKRDLELAQRSPGLLHMLIPGSSYTYRDLSSQIHRPDLRFIAHADTVQAFSEAHRRLAGYGEAAAAIEILYLAAMVAPAVAEAAPAVASAASDISLKAGIALTSSISTGARLIGGALVFAGGALRAMPGNALQFYLSNPILVNEIGLFTVETLVSVEGDVPGLLRMLRDDPVQAAQFFAQVWLIHMSARTPAGNSYDVEIHARPLPMDEQTGPALRLRPVSAPAVTPVPETAGAAAGPSAVVQGGGRGSGKPVGMLRHTDALSRGVSVDTIYHPVYRNKVPTNDSDMPTPPQAQAARLAVNASQDLPYGHDIDQHAGAPAPGQSSEPARMGPKPPRPTASVRGKKPTVDASDPAGRGRIGKPATPAGPTIHPQTGHEIIAEIRDEGNRLNDLIEISKPSLRGKLTSRLLENPGQHDPTPRVANDPRSPYNPTKAVMPPDQVDLFRNSIQYGENRYAMDSDGFIHQFQPSVDNVFHWAGSENGRTASGRPRGLALPPGVRALFKR